MLNKGKYIATIMVVAGLLVLITATAVASSQLLPVEALGKAIFFDENLSANANQACASCHGPEAGWTGPISDINAHGAVYEGSISGEFGNRKPPSAAYATLSPIFYMDKKGLFVGGNFWNGRATGEKLGNPAADQAQFPFLNPVEQALGVPLLVDGEQAAEIAVQGTADQRQIGKGGALRRAVEILEDVAAEDQGHGAGPPQIARSLLEQLGAQAGGR